MQFGLFVCFFFTLGSLAFEVLMSYVGVCVREQYAGVFSVTLIKTSTADLNLKLIRICSSSAKHILRCGEQQRIFRGVFS